MVVILDLVINILIVWFVFYRQVVVSIANIFYHIFHGRMPWNKYPHVDMTCKHAQKMRIIRKLQWIFDRNILCKGRCTAFDQSSTNVFPVTMSCWCAPDCDVLLTCYFVICTGFLPENFWKQSCATVMLHAYRNWSFGTKWLMNQMEDNQTMQYRINFLGIFGIDELVNLCWVWHVLFFCIPDK